MHPSRKAKSKEENSVEELITIQLDEADLEKTTKIGALLPSDLKATFKNI